MTRYILMVFAGACSYGILSTFVKLSYREGYTAAQISVSQALAGMLFLWLLVCLNKQWNFRQYTLKTLLWLLPTGAAIGFSSFVYYLSVVYLPASVAIIILMQFTWIGLLLEWLIYKQAPGRSQLMITVLIILGSGMGSGGISAGAHLPLKGLALAALSALLYAIYLLANARVGKTIPALPKSAVMMTGSFLGLLLANLPELSHAAHLDLGLLKWALFLATFGTIIPPILFSKGVPKIGVGVSAVLMTAELPVAVICSHWLLNEKVTVVQWLGVAVMLFAMFLLNVKKK
ncbi:Threonine/homoserine efflux transporter RhtA [Chitinophaga terrae (ex Kim and Jung 2007)]|uniref:Threonine/homoserine efflux transporter RhtA n=1 Tax=Chitinophaga terrae (ex Kim and Jung 2007) TaxID=408074 RepID=A0A1H3YSL2_9BACT|nr:DMT family transporter [Chitinophaga terrae (ex Kim and Jung 2007)]GEP88486.1 multidrug transporter [Chitinophaga terrae (ex Kim and Jung 2007)]SEA14545.1 Threonine/homoserine efflux transporter RhtA [Chitinophaga terrae (ex Kim and Jung 2007)]